MPPSLSQLLMAWGVPVGYLALCIITKLISAQRAQHVPDDLAPTAKVPDLHPVLLGALRYHRGMDIRSERRACQVALAGLVSLMGRGSVTFEERAAADNKADEGDEPVATGGRSRRGRTRRSTDQQSSAFGAGLWVDVRARELAPYDREAVELMMPEGTRSASIAELCGRIDSGDSYRPLQRFLGRFSGDLFAAGLARSPSILSQIVFSGPVTVLSVLWCLFGSAAAGLQPSPAFAPTACALMLAIMVCRAVLVDLGPRLTPTGAQFLGQANANVRWAEGAARGDFDPARDLAPTDTAGLLAVLLAMGCPAAASDLADQLARDGYERRDDAPGAASAVRFCARRTYIETSSMREDLSPAWLLIKKVGDLARSMS